MYLLNRQDNEAIIKCPILDKKHQISKFNPIISNNEQID